MAGGRGTRLRPLTCHLPKPMVPLLGRPVLTYTIEHLKKEGFHKLAITSFYQPHVIQDYFGGGEEMGVSLTYFVEKDPLGTAGSVKNTQSFLTETFLVMSGDALCCLPLRKALEFHEEKEALATLILKQVENPLEYGVVMCDGEGRITRFLEKPSWGQVFSDTVNTGIYILQPEVLDWIKRGERVDFSRDLFPLLLEKGADLFGYVARGYWSDIGTLQQYRKAHQDLMKGQVGIPLPTTAVIGGDILLEEDVSIPSSVRLQGPLYIGRETRIQEGTLLSSSVIGSGCHISSGAEVVDSILWDGVHIGAYGEIHGAVIAGEALLGDQVILEEESLLGFRVRVGDYARIQQGVKIWPDGLVEKQATLSRHLVKNQSHPRSLFGKHGACGRANLELTPEISCLLGSSFGSLMSSSSTQLVTTDHHPVSRMNGQALQMGILSTGNGVVEGGELILPVLRHAIRTLDLDGGVHVHVHPRRPQELILEFFDQEGQNLPSDRERELERMYDQGRLRRAPQDEIGPIQVRKGLEDAYLQGLLQGVRGEGNLRLLACHDDHSAAALLERLVTGMGCQLLSSGQKPLAVDIPGFQEEIKAVKADVGCILYHNGEELILFTEEGYLVDEDHYQVLLAILLKEKNLLPLVFPVTAPCIIEDVAGGEEVIRTGSHHHQVLKTFFEVHGERTPYSPFQDGLVTLSWLTDYLLAEGISLEELCYSIPPFYRVQEEISCPQQEKGRILRYLAQEMEEEPSLAEGVSFPQDTGQALVLPHGEEPLFHIYAEASSQEEAQELAQGFLERIHGLL